MRRILTVILVVLILILPASSLAADALDNEYVVQTRKTTTEGQWLVNMVDGYNEEETETYDEGEIIYILWEYDLIIYGNYDGTMVFTYYACNTEYGIRFIYAGDTENYDYPKPITKKVTKTSTVSSSTSSGEGSNGRWVHITAYCSACNGGGGTGTASGVPAYVGGCAMKGVPFGTVVHTSYGDFTVIDRPGGKSILDIYIGEFDHCPCSGYGYSGKEYVTWD